MLVLAHLPNNPDRYVYDIRNPYTPAQISRNEQIRSIPSNKSIQEIPFPADPPRHTLASTAAAANPRTQRRNDRRAIGPGDADPDGVCCVFGGDFENVDGNTGTG